VRELVEVNPRWPGVSLWRLHGLLLNSGGLAALSERRLASWECSRKAELRGIALVVEQGRGLIEDGLGPSAQLSVRLALCSMCGLLPVPKMMRRYVLVAVLSSAVWR
jgi:hypothetical protein